MSYIEKIQRRVHSKTSLYGTWLPTDPIAVGEYGSVRLGRFNREGNVASRGVDVAQELVSASPSVLAFSSETSFRTLGTGSAGAEIPRAAGNLEITFANEGAYVYQLRDIGVRRIADRQTFFRDLFLTILRGHLKWQEQFVLIDEVREVGSATVMVLESDNGQLLVKGDVPLDAEAGAPLARADAGLSFEVQRGSIFHAECRKAATPLYSARRLIVDPDPPNGPEGPLGSMAQWLKERIDRFSHKPGVIRAIDYVSDEDTERLVFEELDTKARFVLKASNISIDEFLMLSGAGGEGLGTPDFEEESQSKYIPKQRYG